MDRSQQGGKGARLRPSSSHLERGPSRRGPRSSWPEWGVVALPAPWWEAVADPCPSPRRQQGPAEPRRVRAIARRAGEVIHLKGGGPAMARIFAILTALASLFLVAGASTKY